jgi:hypothetical protein
MSLDPLARSLVDLHRRAVGGGGAGGSGSEASACARAALVAALDGDATDALCDALSSAAGSAGTFKVSCVTKWRCSTKGCAARGK